METVTTTPVPKKSSYDPERYQRSKEARLANQKRYYDTHAELCRQRKREYYAKKREQKAALT